MKMLIRFLIPCLLMTSLHASIEKFEKKLESAETNLAMKLAAYDLQEEYLKQIEVMSTKVEKKLDKEKKKKFSAAKKIWLSYYKAEKGFITGEFNDQKKYGTSGSLVCVTKENDLLKYRYEYLKKMLKSL